ncbi:MAG: hypothetical protein AABY00_00965 [Nanoarchaeota archaeon]
MSGNRTLPFNGTVEHNGDVYEGHFSLGSALFRYRLQSKDPSRVYDELQLRDSHGALLTNIPDDERNF